MHTSGDMHAQRVVMKVFVMILVEAGVIDRDVAIEGFQQAKRQIANSAIDQDLRARMEREIESVLNSLETHGRQKVH